MTYSQQVQNMCPITKGPKHGPAPIPEEGAWVKAYEIKAGPAADRADPKTAGERQKHH